MAGPWHDKPRFSRGGRRILGGVLTGEAWVSLSCRYTEVTRPECSRTHRPAQKWGEHVECWAQFLPHVLLFSGNGLLSTPRQSVPAQSTVTCTHCLACTFETCHENLRIFLRGRGPLFFFYVASLAVKHGWL